ncbi:MAG TPA: glycosyltransferase family 9 protein [Gemmatimonadaceae bacterium]|nr:glycosyltransferase family 9 protein [Gemmatimonadaceae bacterium]
MAQTRTITRKKLAAIGALDIASLAVHAMWRPPSARSGEPRSFLVVEPWGIGDVVLSTSLLRALRTNYPAARISLLAKRYAKDLLAHSGLVDNIVCFDFPWTAFEGKLTPSKYVPKQFQKLISQLRSLDIDVSFDARRDIRSNLITYFSGARRRIGYDFGGGAHLLTDVLPSGNQNEHKVTDWLALLEPLGAERRDFAPTLTVTEAEKANARRRLAILGLSQEKPILAVHPGARQAVRRWNPQRFATSIDALVEERGVQILVFEEEEGDSSGISPRHWVRRVKGDLRGFMALVSQVDLLLCSDSGPMHIATALGTPVTALFGPQRREWYGPRGELDSVVQVDDMACRPCFDACIFASPVCMDNISVEAVVRAVSAQLDRVESHSAGVARHG